MADQSIVRDEDGNPTHVREVSDDGTTSTLYEYDGSFLSGTWDHKGSAVEVADHKEDGTTQAYDYDGSFLSSMWDHKGDKK